MSIVPEILLHRTLINGFAEIRKDPTIIDSLLGNLSQRDLKKFKDFFMSNLISIDFNFPRGEAVKVPAIVIQLQSESETQGFLGDQLETGECAPDQDMLVDTPDGDGASISNLYNLPEKLYGNIQVQRSYTDPATDTTRIYWASNTDVTALTSALKNVVGNVTLHVILGQGAGQVAQVTTITNNYIDINSKLIHNLDSTSFIDLRRTQNPTATVGEPSRIYREDDVWLSRKGALYEAQYQLNIVAGSQQEVLHLYTLTKALFMSQRVFLEAQGLQNFVMSASDFSPKGEYLPAIVYQRAMNCKFTYLFSFVDKLAKISSIDFTIKTCALGSEVTEFTVELQD